MRTIKDMLTDLLGAGWSQSSLAKELGTTQPTVHRMANGQPPSYELGKRIEVLHLDQFPCDISQNNKAA